MAGIEALFKPFVNDGVAATVASNDVSSRNAQYPLQDDGKPNCVFDVPAPKTC